MNALEKARLAKEAERQEKEAKRGANKFVIFGALMIIIAIGVCLFAVITIINQVKGLTILTNDALSTLKTSFYISLGIFVIGAGLSILGYFLGKKIDKASNSDYYNASYSKRRYGHV